MSGACCCSPLGPGPSPSPSGGAALVGMPLHFPFGGGFSCCGAGGVTGFAGAGATPPAPMAFSSGGAGVDLRSGFGKATFGWTTGTAVMSAVAFGFVVNITVPGGGSIPANSGTSLSVTVPGVLATDSVWANQTSAVFSVGVAIVNAYSTGANSVTLQIHNCTTSSQSIPSNFPLRVGILRG